VTGVDFSRRSVEYARQFAEEKQLPIDYVLGNYLKFSTDQKFDLITMIYCDFCPLSPVQRRTLFGKFRDYLKVGGAVLMDVLSMNHFESTQESASYDCSPGNGFWSDGAYYEFTNTFKYQNERLILSKHTIVESNRTREIFNWLQCYSLESLETEFEENGFRIVEHYSDVAGTPFEPNSPQIALVAKRID
jgi:SAM-dependent methyltransferase